MRQTERRNVSSSPPAETPSFPPGPDRSGNPLTLRCEQMLPQRFFSPRLMAILQGRKASCLIFDRSSWLS
jgi:hypothetical protein